MSEENVEVVRKVYEAVARGDTDTVLAAYDSDVEWEFSSSPFGLFLNRSTYRGLEGMRDFIRERYDDAWKDVTDELDELIEAGDRVISVVTTHGHGRASGAEAEMTHYGVWTIRHGRITRVVWLGTHAEALEAAGLSE